MASNNNSLPASARALGEFMDKRRMEYHLPEVDRVLRVLTPYWIGPARKRERLASLIKRLLRNHFPSRKLESHDACRAFVAGFAIEHLVIDPGFILLTDLDPESLGNKKEFDVERGKWIPCSGQDFLDLTDAELLHLKRNIKYARVRFEYGGKSPEESLVEGSYPNGEDLAAERKEALKYSLMRWHDEFGVFGENENEENEEGA